MYNFKKFMAIACSATMLVSTPLTVFAAEPTSTPGDGTILAYSVDTVTVPTSVKLAFNPMGLDFDTGADDPVNSQIVSLNYGVASSATMDRTVTVKFKAVPTNGSEGEDIVFVDDIKKAQAYAASTNENGAKKGEYKVYLAVAASAAAPEKVAGTPFDASTNLPTANDLSNVSMAAATKGLSAFEDGENAEIAYLLDKATYGLKAGEAPDFTTDNEALAEMMELKTLGGVVGFTFTGAMNPDADWTKAKTSAVVITPTYKIVDATGEEEELGAEGGYKQIGTGVSYTATTATYDEAYKVYAVNLASAVTALSDVTDIKVNGETVAANLNADKNKIKINRADIKTALGETTGWADATTLEFTFKVSGVNYKATIAKQ